MPPVRDYLEQGLVFTVDVNKVQRDKVTHTSVSEKQHACISQIKEKPQLKIQEKMIVFQLC